MRLMGKGGFRRQPSSRPFHLRLEKFRAPPPRRTIPVGNSATQIRASAIGFQRCPTVFVISGPSPKSLEFRCVQNGSSVRRSELELLGLSGQLMTANPTICFILLGPCVSSRSKRVVQPLEGMTGTFSYDRN